MRRSVWATLVIAVVGAVAALAALVWMPAVRERHDRAWQDAGERAIAAARLPSRFHVFRASADRSFSCLPHCYLTSGDPRGNVSAARAALTTIATGQVRTSCGADGGFAVAPDRCRLVVPVDGSRLDVFLYSLYQPPKDRHRPVSAEDFHGTVLQLMVSPRS